MTRVLLLADSPYFGGVTSHLLSVVDAFRAAPTEFDPVLATLSGTRDDETLLRAAIDRGVKVHVLPMNGLGDVRVVSRLSRLLQEHDIDLVHTHGYRGTLVMSLAGRRVPTVNTCHGALVGERARVRLWQWTEIQVMRQRPVAVACSEYVRSWLSRRGVRPEHIRVVRNAVAQPVREGTLSRESLGIGPSRLVVAYIGRLVHGKGLETLISALARLPEATGLIVGDGPLWGALDMMAEAMHADVRFLGAVQDPWPCYRLADIVVLPSGMEGLPMVLVEAAAAGKPCVACPVGGVPEVVRDGETGLLVNHRDVASLCAALRQLAGPEVRARMGARARNQWEQSFHPERLARELADVYGEVLDDAAR